MAIWLSTESCPLQAATWLVRLLDQILHEYTITVRAACKCRFAAVVPVDFDLPVTKISNECRDYSRLGKGIDPPVHMRDWIGIFGRNNVQFLIVEME